MDGGKEPPYPKRPGEPDCRYYMNTGFCKFRTTCRFNHPLNREQVAAKDDYPERFGLAECQHYLKTGFCKFGAVCKYHHPREARSTCPSSEIHTSRQEMPEICSKTTDPSEPTPQNAAPEILPTGNASCGTRDLGTSSHGASNHETSNYARSSSSKLVSSRDDVHTQERKLPEPRTKLARQIEASKLHWTELSPRFDSPGNEDSSNREIYETLLQDPLYSYWFRGRIDVDFSDMVLGQKFAEGGEAEIYEVKFGRDTKPTKFDPRFVLKVFKAGFSLRDFQRQWPCGLPSEQLVQAGMVMDDDRFAYLLYRQAIDLRKLIEVAQEDQFPLWNRKHTRLEHLRTYKPKPRSHGCSVPIFSNRCARRIMFAIAWSMNDYVHSRGIVHRDLKSSNVLCSDWKHDLDHADFSSKKWIYCEVADCESADGVVGTGFWRAPEVLLQLKEKSAEVEFTRAADVYSFAMVCYEIFTGHVPFEGYAKDDYDDVLKGVRPTLPNHVPTWAQDLIRKCWHQDPLERPTFQDIWLTFVYEDQLNERREFPDKLAIQGGPNVSARVPLEGPLERPENSGGGVELEDPPLIPSSELCMICEKKRTHPN